MNQGLEFNILISLPLWVSGTYRPTRGLRGCRGKEFHPVSNWVSQTVVVRDNLGMMVGGTARSFDKNHLG